MQGEDTVRCIIRMARYESLVKACIGVMIMDAGAPPVRPLKSRAIAISGIVSPIALDYLRAYVRYPLNLAPTYYRRLHRGKCGS